ncbi:MAG: rhodanese-like domain-containing protein [Nitrospirota bacterium]|jgi:3-mercaptopyruvate sulfurtransferase SseA
MKSGAYPAAVCALAIALLLGVPGSRAWAGKSAAVHAGQPFELSEEKLVSVQEMKELVARGPDKGGYLLVDSRSSDAYAAGHIPGAVSIPYPRLEKMREQVLPGNKDARIIFYCGGSD